jgi:hypothetical protein
VKFLTLLFWGLLFYFGYKAIKQVLGGKTNETRVKGKPKGKSLNIDDSQIEDADFEELDDKH